MRVIRRSLMPGSPFGVRGSKSQAERKRPESGRRQGAGERPEGGAAAWRPASPPEDARPETWRKARFRPSLTRDLEPRTPKERPGVGIRAETSPGVERSEKARVRRSEKADEDRGPAGGTTCSNERPRVSAPAVRLGRFAWRRRGRFRVQDDAGE